MKIFWLFGLLSSLLVAASCKFTVTPESNKKKLTSREGEGVRAAGEYFGGTMHYKTGREERDGEVIDYFELTSVDSDLIRDQYMDLLEMPASKIALLFYQNLAVEKSNYTHIRVVIEVDGKNVYKQQFNTELLEVSETVEETFYEASNELQKLDYESLTRRLDTIKYPQIDEELVELYSAIDSTYAPVQRSEFTGFSFTKAASGKANEDLAVAAGVFIFESFNLPITYYFRLSDGVIEGIKFSW